MALAVDVSSPALAWATTGNPQTASFTPPGGALLVAVVGCNQTTAQTTVTFTPTTTGVTGLTWTAAVKRDNAENAVTNSGAAGIYVAALPGSTVAMTVGLAATNAADSRWVAAYVVTGADSGASAIGAVAEGGVSTTNPLDGTLTALQTGSLLFVGVSEWNANSAPTSTALTEQGFDNAGQLSASAGYRTMSAAGVATTWDFSSTAAPIWTWVSAEIATPPPAGGSTINSISATNRARFRASTW